jgi:hypothetical protein
MPIGERQMNTPKTITTIHNYPFGHPPSSTPLSIDTSTSSSYPILLENINTVGYLNAM